MALKNLFHRITGKGKRPEESMREYVERGIGSRLSALGDFLGIEFLTYNRWHFIHFERLAQEAAVPTIDAIFQVYPGLRSAVDVGCGTGDFALELMNRGLNVKACEYNVFGRESALKKGVDCVAFDLFREPPSAIESSFDLAICFEVAEHIPPCRSNNLVKYLASLSDLVVFTAAIPGQGGTGHINEKPKEFWIEIFRSYGMCLDNDATNRLSESLQAMLRDRSPWLWKNCLIFSKINIIHDDTSNQN